MNNLGTILAGLMAAALRKYMFDDKKPTWSYAIVITILCDVIHMLLIFITNMKGSVCAFEFVKGATLPMVIGNVVAVGLSLMIVSLFSRDGIKNKLENEHIAETFQRWLLVCIVIAFFVTSLFTYVLQNGMVDIETKELFHTSISDVKKDVREKSDARLLEILARVRAQHEADPTSL